MDEVARRRRALYTHPRDPYKRIDILAIFPAGAGGDRRGDRRRSERGAIRSCCETGCRPLLPAADLGPDGSAAAVADSARTALTRGRRYWSSTQAPGCTRMRVDLRTPLPETRSRGIRLLLQRAGRDLPGRREEPRPKSPLASCLRVTGPALPRLRSPDCAAPDCACPSAYSASVNRNRPASRSTSDVAALQLAAVGRRPARSANTLRTRPEFRYCR